MEGEGDRQMMIRRLQDKDSSDQAMGAVMTMTMMMMMMMMLALVLMLMLMLMLLMLMLIRLMMMVMMMMVMMMTMMMMTRTMTMMMMMMLITTGIMRVAASIESLTVVDNVATLKISSRPRGHCVDGKGSFYQTFQEIRKAQPETCLKTKS